MNELENKPKIVFNNNPGKTIIIDTKGRELWFSHLTGEWLPTTEQLWKDSKANGTDIPGESWPSS